MDNPEPLATLGTQDTGRRQTEQQQKHNTTQKTKKMSTTVLTRKPGMNPGACEILSSYYIF
jgi:hypothetical protein